MSRNRMLEAAYDEWAETTNPSRRRGIRARIDLLEAQNLEAIPNAELPAEFKSGRLGKVEITSCLPEGQMDEIVEAEVLEDDLTFDRIFAGLKGGW